MVKSLFSYTLVLRHKRTDKYELMPGPSVWCSWNNQVCERFYMIPVEYDKLCTPHKNKAFTKQQFLDYINNSALLHHMTKKALTEKLESIVSNMAS